MLKKGIFYIVLGFIIVISCTNNDKTIEVSSLLEKELREFNINAKIKVSERVDIFTIDLKYTKPYKIVGDDFEDVFMSYLAFSIYNNIEIENDIKIINYLDKEETFNKREVSYNRNKINKLKYDSNNQLFVKLLKYCFNNFTKADAISINESILLMNDIFPKITKEENIFELLLNFSQNENSPLLKNKSDAIMVLMYFYYKDMINEVTDVEYKKKSVRVSNIIFDLWKMVKKSNIQTQSEYFSKLLLHSPLNEEEVIYNE